MCNSPKLQRYGVEHLDYWEKVEFRINILSIRLEFRRFVIVYFLGEVEPVEVPDEHNGANPAFLVYRYQRKQRTPELLREGELHALAAE